MSEPDFSMEWRDADGAPHATTLRMRPVPEAYARVYRRRGMDIPESHSGHAAGALVPYRFRAWHQRYASTHGFFWLRCVLCGESFGGHEIGDHIPDPTRGPRSGLMICPACTARRNGGAA